MNYTISDLMNGAKIMAHSVFGNKKEYNITFNKEQDGYWYVDFPGWPFDHHNLMMVAGADNLCEFLSDDKKTVTVSVIPESKENNHLGYAKLIQTESSLTGGSTYKVTGIEGFNRNIWLCPVTLFVLGTYPKYLYIKK